MYQRESDGLWVGSVSLGYDARTGKRRRKVVYGTTKAETLEKLRAVDPNAPGTIAVPTVASFLASWLTSVRPSVEPTTWDGYDQHARLHITPRIGTVKLSALTALHVQELLSGLLTDKVSPALAKKVGVTVRTALNAAVKMKLVPSNVAQCAPLPKVPRYVPKVWTSDQVNAFMTAATSDRFEALYLVAIDSGCRQGELLALLWSDFDPASGGVTITKSLANRQGKVWVKEVKRDRSRRRVVLSFSLDALTATPRRCRR